MENIASVNATFIQVPLGQTFLLGRWSARGIQRTRFSTMTVVCSMLTITSSGFGTGTAIANEEVKVRSRAGIGTAKRRILEVSNEHISDLHHYSEVNIGSLTGKGGTRPNEQRLEGKEGDSGGHDSARLGVLSHRMLYYLYKLMKSTRFHYLRSGGEDAHAP
ncbi:hypothetical protein FRC20_001175 [Serendipita sp. 405]|nr:hypothetical protein FRC20_001175 [Serendipita sp. 405]